MNRAFVLILVLTFLPATCFASGHLADLSFLAVIIETIIIVASLVVNIRLLVIARSSRFTVRYSTIIPALLINIAWIVFCVYGIIQEFIFFNDYSHWYPENMDPSAAGQLMTAHTTA